MNTSLQVDISNVCNLNCKYCVSKMNPSKDRQRKEYHWCDAERNDQIYEWLKEARKDTEVMVLTGTGEPLMCDTYLLKILELNKKLAKPFEQVELQTNGHLLSFNMLQKLKAKGVTLVAVSTPSLMTGVQKSYTGSVNPITSLIGMINYACLIPRITYILTDEIDYYNEPEKVVDACFRTGASQVTMKRMWKDEKSEVSDWISQHDISEESLEILRNVDHPNFRLDEHCMTKEWLVLRPWGLRKDWHS